MSPVVTMRRIMTISVITYVKSHVSNILSRLGVASRIEAVILALRKRLVV
jgi:DNA-binding NarL/FixJ family response regulator